MISNIIFGFMQFILAVVAHLAPVAIYNLVLNFPGRLIPQTIGSVALTMAFKFLINGNISQAVSALGCAWIIHQLLAENSALSEAWENAIKHELELLDRQEDLRDQVDELCKNSRSLLNHNIRLQRDKARLQQFSAELKHDHNERTKTIWNLRDRLEEHKDIVEGQRREIREHIRRAVIRHGILTKAIMDLKSAESEIKCLRGQIIFIKADFEGVRRNLLRSRQSLGLKLIVRRSLP